MSKQIVNLINKKIKCKPQKTYLMTLDKKNLFKKINSKNLFLKIQTKMKQMK